MSILSRRWKKPLPSRACCLWAVQRMNLPGSSVVALLVRMALDSSAPGSWLASNLYTVTVAAARLDDRLKRARNVNMLFPVLAVPDCVVTAVVMAWCWVESRSVPRVG